MSFSHSCFYGQFGHFGQITRVHKIRFAVDRSDRKEREFDRKNFFTAKLHFFFFDRFDRKRFSGFLKVFKDSWRIKILY